MKKTLFFLTYFFSITIAMAQADCSTPIGILLNSTTTAPAFTNETGAAPTQFCGLNNNNQLPTKGKWYRYAALANNTVILSTLLPQNNNSDTRVIVYTGDCNSLVCVGANDDYNGTYSSYLSFTATAGTTYTIAFDNRYSQAAFDFTLMLAPPPAPDRLSFTSTPVAGITGGFNNCIVDMNGDFKDDIVSAISTTQLAISYQQAGGTFSTTTFTVANTTVTPSWSIAAGDYDNNGYNDIVYGSGSGVTFLKANADGTAYSTFRKPQNYLTQRTNFVDINNDGYLDAFVCDDNSPNRYYYNDGTGTIGEQNQGGLGLFPTGGNYAGLWFDYDNDGDIDMHMSKCGQGGSGVGGNIDEMYKNNGNGTYTNVAATANLAAPEQSWSSAIGDFNNDGWMDIILGVNSTSNGNTNVMKNNTDGTFTSVTTGSGYETVFATGREYVAQDFDNDGFLDVLGSGSTIMFGDGAFHFVPNPNMYPLSAVDRPIGDLNNDGFLDIQNGTNVLFNNGNSNKWLNINLHGVQSNRNGIGARVEIYGVWGKQIRDVQSGTGFQNMSTITAHFGIGQATTIAQVIIRWPSGIIDAVSNVNPNQSLAILEGSSPLGTASFTSAAFSLFPNPAQSVLNIKTNDNLVMKSGQVFDLNGKSVLQSDISNSTINVEKLTIGTYILLLTDINGKEYSQKFLKE
jgi:ASPIC and UnbV/FG-GAP-like repeat/Secretion system C-terminal sorting domain